MMLKKLVMFFGLMIINFTQKLSNCQIFQQKCQIKIIEVSGQGSASTFQDMAIAVLRFKQNGPTAASAVKSLSNKVSLALILLEKQKATYQPNYFDVSPLYNNMNNRAEIIGVSATLILVIKLTKIDSYGSNLAKLIDNLALINGISIESVTFDVNDKSKIEMEAKTNAYLDAKIKAQGYASLTGLQLGKIIHVEDSSILQLSKSDQTASFQSQNLLRNILAPFGYSDYQYSTKITFQLK